ncbi:MAG TPA: hypothetical protein VG273_26430 [Bryobacteraceae bacterium]|jgi:hypothetical protein|nr:hypothetical protein [Bryobacteraceae bacterium]
MNKIGLILLAGAALAQAPPAPGPETAAKPAAPASNYRNVGNMSRLMIDIIYPTSDAIFYVDRDEPKTDLQWNTLASNALILAESGNLLMMPGRARDQENWITDSKLMTDAGAAAYKAARAKDIEGVRAVNDKLYQSCVACHTQYRSDYPRRPAAKK